MNGDILAMEQAAIERWRNGDPMAWAEISAPEITYVDPELPYPIVGLDDYTTFLQGLAGKIHYDHSEFIAPHVVEVGDAAILSYNYRSSWNEKEGRPGGSALWNTTEVYARKEGEWMAVHSHWSPVHHGLPNQLVVPIPIELKEQHLGGVSGEIFAMEAAAMKRWRSGDPWGFIEISAPDVTYFDTGTPLRINGRDALAAEYKLREGKIFYDVQEFIDPIVKVYGDLAILFYRFFSTRLKPDGCIASRTPWYCTEVFIHSDGAWRIAHTHWSIICGERLPG